MSGSQDPRCPATRDRSVLRRRRFRVALRLVVLTLSVALLAGCGGTDHGGDAGAPRTTPLTLTLDFAPNAVHAGLYVAEQRGTFRRARLNVQIRVPGSGADGAKLLAAGKTDLAIMDIHDLALAREGGADLVAVAAIVQRPLAAVLAASPAVRRPRDLQGRQVGVTGLPSDDAALDQIVRGDGGDPRRVQRATIGYEAVASVLSGKVDAAIGFWNAEGVALRARRPAARIFRLDDYGAPRYPELLVVATGSTLHHEPDAIARFAAAIAAGYRTVAQARTPAQAQATVDALRQGSGDRTIDPKTTAAQLAAVRPAFTDRHGRAATIDRAQMRRWAAWEARVGIVTRAPDIDRLVWRRAP